MAKKKLPDLDSLRDEQVLGLLRGEVRLSFSRADAYRKRIDRMATGIYEEAAQLFQHLREDRVARSTGRAF